ncbi:MAG: CDP-diacylglycerol--glycerol-3-phosphate 3-phosphatidyltransferase [Candidatus Fermentibacteraceae bacterium]|nr:CDP-diacylglycerol--glycerol-3-phosphate 3-phosphatidyltransferase [Candidatus Fermentibacteraceae bacterium]
MALNWPNRLTIARIVMAPVVMILLQMGTSEARWAALIVFVTAALTDMVDGYLARKYGWISNLGKFLDPLADKLLVCLAWIGLSELGLVPQWTVYIVVGRELLVSGLRSIAAYAGVLIMPSGMGKWKAAVQMFSVSYYMLLSVLKLDAIPRAASIIGETAMWAALVLTVVSALHYFWRNRNILQRLGM